MGVNQSKGSVDITSTPNKGGELNGKTVDEKIIDEKTKVNIRKSFVQFFFCGAPILFV